MKLLSLITEQVQETYFEEFKSWWMEKRNNDEDPINIEFDIEGVDFKRSLRNAIDVEVPGHIFFILSKLWEMWGTDSGNEQILNTIEDRHEFGKKLMFLMRKNDFVFDKEAMGAKTAVDRQDKDAFQKEYPDVSLNEQNWEPWDGDSVNPDYPLWDGSYLNGVTYFQSCNETIKFVFNLDGNDYELEVDTSGGATWWDQDGDGVTDPPPSGYIQATLPNLPTSGILLSLLIEYMMGNSSILNDYNTVDGPMGGLSLGNVTQDYIQVNNAGELFSYVYPNLLGSLNISEDGIATINSNALQVSPLIQIALPDFGSSVQFTTVGELQSMINSCIEVEPTPLRWQCPIGGGECVSSEDPTLPFATLEECEAADNACGPQDQNLETCYQCDKNGNVVAQQFPGPPISWECPKGWSLQEPNCKQPLDADGDGYVDSVNINKPKKKPVPSKVSALREMLQRRAGIDKK